MAPNLNFEMLLSCPVAAVGNKEILQNLIIERTSNFS
jgi:hypothetical protein